MDQCTSEPVHWCTGEPVNQCTSVVKGRLVILNVFECSGFPVTVSICISALPTPLSQTTFYYHGLSNCQGFNVYSTPNIIINGSCYHFEPSMKECCMVSYISPMKFEQTDYFVNSLLQQFIRVNDYPYKSKSTMLLKYHK